VKRCGITSRVDAAQNVAICSVADSRRNGEGESLLLMMVLYKIPGERSGCRGRCRLEEQDFRPRMTGLGRLAKTLRSLCHELGFAGRVSPGPKVWGRGHSERLKTLMQRSVGLDGRDPSVADWAEVAINLAWCLVWQRYVGMA
jgi:hypothetical protein